MPLPSARERSKAKRRAEAGPRGTTIPLTGKLWRKGHRRYRKMAAYLRPRKGGRRGGPSRSENHPRVDW